MTTRLDALIGTSYTLQRFADLPQPYQLALIWFMAVDGGAWDSVELPDVSEADLKSMMAGWLPKYVALYGESLFGVACPSARAVQDAVMRDPDIAQEFPSWAEYHTWYLGAGDVPTHLKTDRWPVILSDDDSEMLRDGWHRFHSYIRAGALEIPAVFFPEDRHRSQGHLSS